MTYVSGRIISGVFAVAFNRPVELPVAFREKTVVCNKDEKPPLANAPVTSLRAAWYSDVVKLPR